MNLLDLMLKRRSVRTYSEETIKEADLKMILQAGLASPSGRARRPWEFIVVQDKEMLAQMAECRIAGAGMLRGAAAAIVVVGDETLTDVWTEDCSIAMTQMHLMASSLGVGSCWIQGRLREAEEGLTTEAYLRERLQFPENLRLEAILSLGIPEKETVPHTMDELLEEKIHWEKF